SAALFAPRLLQDRGQPLFVEFHTQTWPVRHGDAAVILQDKGLLEVALAKEGTPLVAIVQDLVVFLDEEVGPGGVKLQRGHQRQWAERAVQRDFGVGGFAHRRDLAAFGDPARVADIGLQYGQRTLAQRIEKDPLAHPAFARGDGRGGPPRDLSQDVYALDGHGFFHKEGTVGRERLDHLQGDGWMRVVDVHSDVDVGTGPGAHRGKVLRKAIQARGDLQPVARAKVDFETA